MHQEQTSLHRENSSCEGRLLAPWLTPTAVPLLHSKCNSAAVNAKSCQSRSSNFTQPVTNNQNYGFRHGVVLPRSVSPYRRTMSTSICAKIGCDRPVFVEARTLNAHKYCGRTHAEEVEGRLPAPHGFCHRCNLHGCVAMVAFDATTGRVHDFCSKEHARKAISRGEWQLPAGRPSHLFLLPYSVVVSPMSYLKK